MYDYRSSQSIAGCSGVSNTKVNYECEDSTHKSNVTIVLFVLGFKGVKSLADRESMPPCAEGVTGISRLAAAAGLP